MKQDCREGKSAQIPYPDGARHAAVQGCQKTLVRAPKNATNTLLRDTECVVRRHVGQLVHRKSLRWSCVLLLESNPPRFGYSDVPHGWMMRNVRHVKCVQTILTQGLFAEHLHRILPSLGSCLLDIMRQTEERSHAHVAQDAHTAVQATSGNLLG